MFAIVAMSMATANIYCLKYIEKAYAHVLNSNENAALLAMFYRIQTEAELAQATYFTHHFFENTHSGDKV